MDSNAVLEKIHKL